jgi:uncharacterized protein
MRVVIDSNVIISAALTRGNVSSKAIRFAEEFHTMLLSEATMNELMEGILRKKFDRYFKTC